MLSPEERGAYYERSAPSLGATPFVEDNFMLPAARMTYVPTALVEISTTRPFQDKGGWSTLPQQVILALFLRGYAIDGSGFMAIFDRPAWMVGGKSHASFGLGQRIGLDQKPISDEEFIDVVELAYKIPPFGLSEDSAERIALSRLLRACGAQNEQDGFLDFAIALEAALLRGLETELTYRFRLYGAMFLREDFPPRETFDRLKNIYEVRSKLVHGDVIKPSKLVAARADAPALAKAVMRLAIEYGWPVPFTFDSMAIMNGAGDLADNAPRSSAASESPYEPHEVAADPS